MVIIGLLMVVETAAGSFVYVPFEQRLSEAELIITGEVLSKAYVEKETISEVSIRDPHSGEIEVTSRPYWSVYTEYRIMVDEVLKGEVSDTDLMLEVHGGCRSDGICVTGSTSYEYHPGAQIFILLKKSKHPGYYRSSIASYTAYKVTADGVIYRSKDELETINGSGFDAHVEAEPQTLDQVKDLLNELSLVDQANEN